MAYGKTHPIAAGLAILTVILVLWAGITQGGALPVEDGLTPTVLGVFAFLSAVAAALTYAAED